MTSKVLVLLAIVVLGAGIIFAFLQIHLNNEDPSQGPQSTNVEEDRVEINELGFIEGSLSFPSETIPSNMIICAREVASEKQVCTDKQIVGEQFTYRVGYQLAVIPGTYEVYAYLPEDPDRRAYYNEFVTCGLSAECESHEVIEVTVAAGETVTGIDPQDWYQISTPDDLPGGQM